MLFFQKDGDDFIVSDERTNVYGEGCTIDDAISDYVISLIEYCELLEAYLNLKEE